MKSNESQFLIIFKRVLLLATLLASLTLTTGCQSRAQTGADLTSISLLEALSNGKPTIAEFGRGTCVPCKEMKPILENLAAEYQGRLNVSIVSVDEYRELTNYYRIMAIPTQIDFDAAGREIFRHVGFWPKGQIVANLNKLGIK